MTLPTLSQKVLSRDVTKATNVFEYPPEHQMTMNPVMLLLFGEKVAGTRMIGLKLHCNRQPSAVTSSGNYILQFIAVITDIIAIWMSRQSAATTFLLLLLVTRISSGPISHLWSRYATGSRRLLLRSDIK